MIVSMKALFRLRGLEAPVSDPKARSEGCGVIETLAEALPALDHCAHQAVGVGHDVHLVPPGRLISRLALNIEGQPVKSGEHQLLISASNRPMATPPATANRNRKINAPLMNLGISESPLSTAPVMRRQRRLFSQQTCGPTCRARKLAAFRNVHQNSIAGLTRRLVARLLVFKERFSFRFVARFKCKQACIYKSMLAC